MKTCKMCANIIPVDCAVCSEECATMSIYKDVVKTRNAPASWWPIFDRNLMVIGYMPTEIMAIGYAEYFVL